MIDTILILAESRVTWGMRLWACMRCNLDYVNRCGKSHLNWGQDHSVDWRSQTKWREGSEQQQQHTCIAPSWLSSSMHACMHCSLLTEHQHACMHCCLLTEQQHACIVPFWLSSSSMHALLSPSYRAAACIHFSFLIEQQHPCIAVLFWWSSSTHALPSSSD